MNIYILYWCDGTIEEIQGETFHDALYKNGYNSSVIYAIDYVETKKAGF